jgi:acetoin utilization deacetylase AcuC-like enzyme
MSMAQAEARARLAVVHHPGYTADTPDGHRFPMRKFALLADLLSTEGFAARGFHVPHPADVETLGMAHDGGYVRAVLERTLDRAAQRRIGFDLTERVVLRARLATAGTLLAARLALIHGLACNTAGGSHHARAGQGAGFCVFNDVAVAAATLLAEGRIRRVLVVDLDVHHGDGTAAIFASEPRVTTFSMHCDANWPLDKPPSTLDIALPEGTGDVAYLDTLSAHLPALIARTRPDIAFYIAGVDPHRDDRLGRLALTDEGLAARDRYSLMVLQQAGIATVTVLGGGYDVDPAVVAARHAIVFRQAAGVLAACGAVGGVR